MPYDSRDEFVALARQGLVPPAVRAGPRGTLPTQLGPSHDDPAVRAAVREARRARRWRMRARLASWRPVTGRRRSRTAERPTVHAQLAALERSDAEITVADRRAPARTDRGR